MSKKRNALTLRHKYPVYTTNRCRAGLVNAHLLVRFRQLFAFTLQQREQD